MKIIVTILTYQRQSHILKIIDSLKNSTKRPYQIIIINNDSDKGEIGWQTKGAFIIDSNYNYGCILRHAIASILNCDYILTLDDDACVESRTIENFINWSEKYPNSILGYYGMNLNKNVNKRIYWDGERIDLRKQKINEPKKVDIIGSRCCWYKPEHANKAIGLLGLVKDYPKTESEDILLSMSNNGGYLVPTIKDGGYIALNEMGVGLSTRNNHKDIRDKSVQLLLDYYKNNL